MTYQALDSKSVVEYVKNCPALENVLPEPAKLVAKEVGDGNLNLVFIIENPDAPSSPSFSNRLCPISARCRRLLAANPGADAICEPRRF